MTGKRTLRKHMDFETLEQKVEELNKIHPNANHKSRYRYKELYRTIYEALLAMEKSGEIVVEEERSECASGACPSVSRFRSRRNKDAEIKTI